MTSLQRRMTAIGGWLDGRVRRGLCDGVSQAVDVPANLLRAEADGGERILDLVGNAAGDLLPGGLLLRTEQFGRVFEDEDVPLMFSAHALGSCRDFEQSDRGEEIHGTAETVC